MRSKATLAIIAAVGLVVVATLAWRFAAARGRVLGGSGASELARTTPTALQGQTRPAPVLDETSAGSMSSAERASLSPREPFSAPSTTRIRVVLAESGKAVAGARAWLELEETDYQSPAWQNAMRRFNDVEPVLQGGQGRELALDERGEALVPRPARELSVVAALGNLHGEATLEPGALECVVQLAPYHSLAFEVVDASGRPVKGALVALAWGEFDPFEQQWTWITGEDGRTWLPKLEEQLFSDGYAGELRAFLAGGVPATPEHVVLDMDHLPETPVRFVAGEHGSVAVQVTDPSGNWLELGGDVHLELSEDLLPDAGMTLRGFDCCYLTLDHGRAVFERVGLGLPLEISVSARGCLSTSRAVLGPVKAGETVPVFVCVGGRMPTARGRIRADPLSSAGNYNLRGQILDGYGFFSARIAGDSTFESPLWTNRPKNTAWALEISRKSVLLARTIAVPTFDEEHAVLDFGDVVFASGTELARLRVVDDHGQAVPRATIRVRRPTDTSQGWSDEDGQLVLSGTLAELPLQVQARMDGWLPSVSVPIATPGSEVTLALRRGARLQGRLECPAGGDMAAFDLQLTIDPAEPDAEGFPSSTTPLEDGRFCFPACAAGRGLLSVYYCGSCMLQREGIELRRGETTELVLDLREKLHAIELTFEIEAGEAWSKGSIECQEVDGGFSAWASIGSEPHVTFLARSPIVDVWVIALGARPGFFESVRSGDHLLLSKALSLELRVPSGVRLPEPPFALVARAERKQPQEVPYESGDDLRATVGESGIARLRVPWPGEYELSWVVRNTLIDVEFDLEQEEAQVVVVPEGQAFSTSVVNLTPGQVARAIAAAGG